MVDIGLLKYASSYNTKITRASTPPGPVKKCALFRRERERPYYRAADKHCAALSTLTAFEQDLRIPLQRLQVIYSPLLGLAGGLMGDHVEVQYF